MEHITLSWGHNVKGCIFRVVRNLLIGLITEWRILQHIACGSLGLLLNPIIFYGLIIAEYCVETERVFLGWL